jgi:glycosyltransferase involved in cell wall biosynthesis
VSHGPLLTLYSQVVANPRESPHLAFSFNFTTLPTGTRRILFRRYLKHVDRFVVASSMERNLYSDFFDIDADRIDVLLWSIRPPIEELSKEPRFGSGRYVCAIGSQARDYETLIESMRHLPTIKLVVVASPDSLPQCAIPPNVHIMTNVPFADAMNVLAHSQFMVLPLSGSSVPCGHVTVVCALHMGKAIVATDSSGLHDYLHDQKTALLAPPGDPTELAHRIELLFNDGALCDRIGAEGRVFAATHCTENNAVDYFRRFLKENGISNSAPA